MTTQQPEALRLADELCEAIAEYPEPTALEAQAAAELRRQHARIAELESQLAQRFDAADMATAAASGFRDGVASVSAWSEHVEQRLLAWRQSFVNRSGDQLALDDFMDEQSLDDLIDFVCDEWALNTHPSPPEGMAGWISVKDRLPEKNTVVLICFAELSIPSTGQYTASALDHEGWCYPQENRLWPGEHPDFEDGGSPTVTHWMPLPAAPGPADGESNELC